jgi:hypothetical protein
MADELQVVTHLGFLREISEAFEGKHEKSAAHQCVGCGYDW